MFSQWVNNSATPLDPWGGPLHCETVEFCRSFVSEKQAKLVDCVSFSETTESFQPGSWCTCTLAIGRVGQDCASYSVEGLTSLVIVVPPFVIATIVLLRSLRMVFFWPRVLKNSRASNLSWFLCLMCVIISSSAIAFAISRVLIVLGPINNRGVIFGASAMNIEACSIFWMEHLSTPGQKSRKAYWGRIAIRFSAFCFFIVGVLCIAQGMTLAAGALIIFFILKDFVVCCLFGFYLRKKIAAISRAARREQGSQVVAVETAHGVISKGILKFVHCTAIFAVVFATSGCLFLMSDTAKKATGLGIPLVTLVGMFGVHFSPCILALWIVNFIERTSWSPRVQPSQTTQKQPNVSIHEARV